MAAAILQADRVRTNPDKPIMTAFDRWCSATIDADTLGGTDDEIAARTECVDALALAIAALPAEGATGLAAKLFVLVHMQCGGEGGDPLTIRDDSAPLDAALQLRLVQDALRLAPEVAHLINAHRMAVNGAGRGFATPAAA